MRFSRPRPWFLLAATIAFGALAGGCQASTSVSQGAPAPTATTEADIGAGAPTIQAVEEPAATDPAPAVYEVLSNDDLVDAQNGLAAARARWAQVGPADYLFEIGFESIGFFKVTVVDGEPGDVTIDAVIADDELRSWFGPDAPPDTVDAVFDVLDEIVLDAINGPVADNQACTGIFFTMRFNTDLGHPTYYDTLGPCDDGIGTTIRVTPTS